MPPISISTRAPGAFEDVADDAPLPVAGAVIVSARRLAAERDGVFARNDAVGVVLESHESPMQLPPEDLQRLSLVVLMFPKFRDGRGFSWARMLRTRLGFRGEIRARGHFLRDQIFFMARCGIDSLEGDHRITAEAVSAALATFTHVYQPAADGRRSVVLARHG